MVMERPIKKLAIFLIVIAAVVFALIKSKVIPDNLISGIVKSQPIESDLLYYVPDGVTGLTVCDSGMLKMQEYWKTDSMKNMRALLSDGPRLYAMAAPFIPEAEKAKGEEISNKVAAIAKAMFESQALKAGLITTGYVQYQQADPKNLFPVSAALAVTNDVLDLKADFEKMKQAGVPIGEEVFEGYTFYVFDYNALFKQLSTLTQAPQFPFPEMKFYFATSGKKFGVGNNKEAIVKYFKGEKFPKKPGLLESPQFKAALANLNYDSSKDFCQSYMDFKSMLESSVSAAGASAGTNVHTPEMEKIFEKFPVSGVTQKVGYNGSITLTQQWAIKESVLPEEARVWIEALATSRPFEGLSSQPANAAVASGVNGEIFEKLKAAADKTPSIAPLISGFPYTDMIAGLQNFSIAIMPPSTGIWPEGLISIKLGKSKELYDIAKEQILAALAKGGMVNAKWLEKTVDGNKIEYFSTPLGVGVYLLEKDNTFKIASSESVVTGASSKETLKDKLKKMGIDRNESAIAETYISAPTLLEMARTIQTSLAMMMPMQIQISKDFDIIAKALGEYYLSVNLKPGFVTYTMSQKTT
jgi:hypothetical protein